MAPSHYLNQYQLIISEAYSIHLRAISQDILKIYILHMSLIIINLRVQPHLEMTGGFPSQEVNNVKSISMS